MQKLVLRQIEQRIDWIFITFPIMAIHAFIIGFVESQNLAKYAMYGDGAEYIWQATQLLSGKLTSVHPLLYPLFIRILATFMAYENAALIIPAIFHIISVIPIYEILKMLRFPYIKLSTIILATFPHSLILYSSLALSDSIAFFFSAFFFYFLLKDNECGLILTGTLASATNFIANLLLFPLAYFYLKTSPKNIYRAFMIVTPLIGLSLYRHYLGHGLMYYLNYHVCFSRTYWEMNPISFPFESLIKAFIGFPTAYPVSLLALLYVPALLALYFFGAVLLWKNKVVKSLSYSVPFLIFLAIYQAWFFIPRYITFCFPLLLGYIPLLRRIVIILALLLAIGGIFYSTYYISNFI